jgi:hypothetical protein
MGNDEHAEIRRKFEESWNPSIFVTTPTVHGTDLSRTAANHAIISQKFCGLNEPRQAFARVVRLGQTQVLHTLLLNKCPGGYDTCVSDLHQHSGVAQMTVLRGLMSRPNITTTMIYWILQFREDHTMRLTDNEDTSQSDEPSILDC